jgi:D-alanine-D-alanine ligase
MIQIAILTGGPSTERSIALNSAKLVEMHLDASRYAHRMIMVEDDGWYDQKSGVQVDLNDFSVMDVGEKIKFDFAFLVIHGTPVEDGKLQGFFETKGIPHSTCSTLTCALTFNKQWCKYFLEKHDIPMAKSEVVRSESIQAVDPQNFSYPVFVKPNNNGSSYGVSRADTPGDLPAALERAAKYDNEIMIEAYMAGREFSCGAVKEGDKVHIFPITELIPEGEFFDYDAKYLGACEEVTPADLDDGLTGQCKNQTRRLYRLLDCRGMVRFDYILVDDIFQLLEVNTVPGLSEASIIPQQARAYGWTVMHMLDVVIRDAIRST